MHNTFAQHAPVKQGSLHFPLFTISLCLGPLSTMLLLIHKIDDRLSSHCAIECQNLFLLSFGTCYPASFQPPFPHPSQCLAASILNSLHSSWYTVVQLRIFFTLWQKQYTFSRDHPQWSLIIHVVPCSLVMLGTEYSSQLARQSRGKTVNALCCSMMLLGGLGVPSAYLTCSFKLKWVHWDLCHHKQRSISNHTASGRIAIPTGAFEFNAYFKDYCKLYSHLKYALKRK